ncbi:2-oxoacid:acceptor oxidoreductase family protein [Thermodesulfobacteriota bacterium]
MAEMILCGRGGQGIVFLTRQIGQIVTSNGGDVISSEAHGMAVRGGSINSHLRIGDYSSPLIRQGHADFLLSLDPSETGNNRHFLKQEGLIVENSPSGDDAGIRRVDATGLAKKVGRVQLENVVLLGFASTVEGFPVSQDQVRAQLERDPRDKVREMNLQALDLGIEAGN